MQKFQTLSATCGPVVGRILLALLFILAGFGKIIDFTGSVGYAASVFGDSIAPLAIIVAILVEFVGGILLLIGFKTRLVAAIVALFTLSTAVFFHNDLGVQNEMIQFLKNLSIVGGLLYVVAYGAGSYSLDAKHSSGVSGGSRMSTPPPPPPEAGGQSM